MHKGYFRQGGGGSCILVDKKYLGNGSKWRLNLVCDEYKQANKNSQFSSRGKRRRGVSFFFFYFCGLISW